MQKPLEFIRINKDRIYRITELFEPKKRAYLTPQTSALYSQNPTMLSKQDSNFLKLKNRGGLKVSKMEHLVGDLTEKYKALLSLGLLPDNIASHYQTS